MDDAAKNKAQFFRELQAQGKTVPNPAIDACAPSTRPDSVPGPTPEEILELLGGAAPMFLAYVDADNRSRYLNRTYAEAFDQPVERMLGRTVGEALGETLYEELRPHIESVLAGNPVAHESLVHFPNHGPRWLNALLTPCKDENGLVVGYMAIVHDVTDRRQAEESLRKSEDRARRRLNELEHVYRTTPVGLCLLDTDLRIVRISDQLAVIHGHPTAEHIGRRVNEFVPPGLAEKIEQLCRAVIESGKPALNLEIRGPRPTDPGREMIGLVSLHPLRAADGSVVGVSAVVQDVTERKQAQESLRESEERLASVLGSAMDAIITFDENLTIRLFNLAAEDVFRCRGENVIGQSFERFAAPALKKMLRQSVKTFRQAAGGDRCGWAPQGLTAVRADGETFPIEATLSQAEMDRQRLYTIILRDVNERRRAEQALQKLQLEKAYLQEEFTAELGSKEIVGKSEAVAQVLQSTDRVAATDATVLITGETGTGKELVARAIHERSTRRDNMLVVVNCAALPGGLIESELFGHEKGAFTGALTRRIGRFETAAGGSIFLDEIGDLPLELQAKLLRVLQEGEFQRVGGADTIKVDVRVIAATNQDLEKAVTEQRFRADLFYRLNVFPIRVPPLRERLEDIPLLARCFALRYAEKMGKRIDALPKHALDTLRSYAWPGNVRELQNVIERAVILTNGPMLELGKWPPSTAAFSSKTQSLSLSDVERQHILDILERTRWRVSGEKGAARILGLKPTTLEARMKKLSIKRP